MEHRLTPISQETRDKLADLARALRSEGRLTYADVLDEVVRAWDAEEKAEQEGGGN